jgi:tRNA-2-methylthio-N6-dimethylallyladenosine synthase
MSIPVAPKQVYIETYGCQMNLADSELVGGILHQHGYTLTNDLGNADVVLVNTCAIRENAEQRVYGRLGLFNSHKKRNPGVVIGVLGCMAERLRTRLVDQEKLVDIVVGPDEYRRLPFLLERAYEGEKGLAVRLSKVENYDDILPFRTDGVSAWLSVMRGCDKFCTFCVVPFTRGRERSRSLTSVVTEVASLAAQGYREVTLLGQNVNSYRDAGCDFADLLKAVAAVDPLLRVRFTTSHPQDMSDRLINAVADTPNICKYIHLPVQSGSDRVLERMNRTYSVNQYLSLVDRIRRAVPGVSLSTDIISGFPGETLGDHQMTVDLLSAVGYDGAYTFKYSARENTRAWEMEDDVPEEEKGRRVNEIAELQHRISLDRNTALIGRADSVLVEGVSKKSDAWYTGRTDANRTVVFPWSGEKRGEYITVRIDRVNSATLFGVRLREGDT